MSVRTHPPRLAGNEADGPQLSVSWSGGHCLLELHGRLCGRTVEQISELLSSGTPVRSLRVELDGAQLARASFGRLLRALSRLPATCATVELSGLDERAVLRVAAG